MIKLYPKEIPDILQTNQHGWTVNLLQTIREYGGYAKIPESIKNAVVNHYRQADIKDAVEMITGGKCAFCESAIGVVDYINIEHFYPKSLYPRLTFKWSNLLPSCRKCNIPKGNFDTKGNPFVNPFKDNPEEIFHYLDLKIEPINGDLRAENTRVLCDLNRLDLLRARSEMLINFYSLEKELVKTNTHYLSLRQNAAKLKIANELLSSLENLREMGDYFKNYSGFMRHLMVNSTIINDSVNIINVHFADLGLPSLFEFKWN